MNINNPTTFGTPNLTLSTSNSSGTGGALRADDTIAIWATPSVALGTSAIAGSAATGIRSDATLGVLATNAMSLGTAAAAGSAATTVRSDSTILAFDTTIPSTLALNHTATAGSATVAGKRDHTHGTVNILLQVITGQYTGDGEASLPITGLVQGVTEITSPSTTSTRQSRPRRSRSVMPGSISRRV